MKEILMPKLGLMQESATILEWCKEPGDRISRGDIVLIVETDKVEQEVEAEDDGILDRILAEKGEEVPILTPIATLREP
jgi:pyruvate dehydrogenase E2 component (dihydrolipoamide acetyltransferase)